MNVCRLKFAFTALLAFSLTACWRHLDGGMHKEGDRVACLRAFYAEPIVGHALVWHGEGDEPNEGISLQNYWFTKDRLAIGVGITGVQFHIPGDRILGGEIEARMRYYYAESGKFGMFADLAGGFMRTQSDIPPAGTRNNGTFAFGPGFEYAFDEDNSLLFGYEFHHMSNAEGKDKDVNPAQNESLWWVGYAFRW